MASRRAQRSTAWRSIALTLSEEARFIPEAGPSDAIRLINRVSDINSGRLQEWYQIRASQVGRKVESRGQQIIRAIFIFLTPPSTVNSQQSTVNSQQCGRCNRNRYDSISRQDCQSRISNDLNNQKWKHPPANYLACNPNNWKLGQKRQLIAVNPVKLPRTYLSWHEPRDKGLPCKFGQWTVNFWAGVALLKNSRWWAQSSPFCCFICCANWAKKGYLTALAASLRSCLSIP